MPRPVPGGSGVTDGPSGVNGILHNGYAELLAFTWLGFCKCSTDLAKKHAVGSAGPVLLVLWPFSSLNH